MLDSGLIKLAALDETAVPWIVALLDRYAYASAEPDLADAALMHLAEREGIDTVFTLDRRDFSILPHHQWLRPDHPPGLIPA
ncbi:MAG: hypothetical protein IRY99_25550 [Isosphaeraceae bacterium]|nr:hypothetical protein [Isosphaeraceae bacterium]